MSRYRSRGLERFHDRLERGARLAFSTTTRPADELAQLDAMIAAAPGEELRKRLQLQRAQLVAQKNLSGGVESRHAGSMDERGGNKLPDAVRATHPVNESTMDSGSSAPPAQNNTRVRHGAFDGERASSDVANATSVSGAAQRRRSAGENAVQELGVTAGETAPQTICLSGIGLLAQVVEINGLPGRPTQHPIERTTGFTFATSQPLPHTPPQLSAVHLSSMNDFILYAFFFLAVFAAGVGTGRALNGAHLWHVRRQRDRAHALLNGHTTRAPWQNEALWD